jgi:hypothetical protein
MVDVQGPMKLPESLFVIDWGIVATPATPRAATALGYLQSVCLLNLWCASPSEDDFWRKSMLTVIIRALRDKAAWSPELEPMIESFIQMHKYIVQSYRIIYEELEYEDVFFVHFPNGNVRTNFPRPSYLQYEESD